MTPEAVKAYMETWLEQNKEECYRLADYLWENPELGLEEVCAHKKITELLQKHGFHVESGAGGLPTAFVASYGKGKPVFGINVEYDCLPGMSQKKEVSHPCPVTEGAPGHGCGHNILGSTAVLSGIALRYALEHFQIAAEVRLLGSPYEEASVGKPVLGGAGIYQGLDFILDWHPWNYNRADYDRCNSVFVVKYHFRGKTCHGAMPWQGRSALDAGMLFGHALELLREHLVPSGPEAAHTINYTFTDCGPLFANIVPDYTCVQLYGRFRQLDISQDALKRIALCAEGAAMATETTVEQEFITYTHNKIPNKTLSEVIHNNMEHYGSPDFSEEEQAFVKEMQKNAGLAPDGLDLNIKEFGESETIICDTSEFSWNAPYATFWLSMAPAGGWHNWMVTACAGSSVGKKTMDRAAQILTSSAIDLILNPEVLNRAKEEWKERMDGKEYKSLLPESYQPPYGINKGIMERYFPDRFKV